jgi:hypothetical protein
MININILLMNVMISNTNTILFFLFTKYILTLNLPVMLIIANFKGGFKISG